MQELKTAQTEFYLWCPGTHISQAMSQKGVWETKGAKLQLVSQFRGYFAKFSVNFTQPVQISIKRSSK